MRDVGPRSVLLREHLRAHVAQGRRRVRVAADVGDAPAAGERTGESVVMSRSMGGGEFCHCEGAGWGLRERRRF